MGFCILSRRRPWPESWVFPLAQSDTGLYVQHGFYDSVNNPWGTRRPELIQSAFDYWFVHYPIVATATFGSNQSIGRNFAQTTSGNFSTPFDRRIVLVESFI